MQKDSKILDDLAKLGTSAFGGVLDIKREIEAVVSAQLEKLLVRMHLATREELEVAHDMASKAREENEKLKKRLDELENTVRSLAQK
jgi:BMFP domain-containing protein YqiC